MAFSFNRHYDFLCREWTLLRGELRCAMLQERDDSDYRTDISWQIWTQYEMVSKLIGWTSQREFKCLHRSELGFASTALTVFTVTVREKKFTRVSKKFEIILTPCASLKVILHENIFRFDSTCSLSRNNAKQENTWLMLRKRQIPKHSAHLQILYGTSWRLHYWRNSWNLHTFWSTKGSDHRTLSRNDNDDSH